MKVAAFEVYVVGVVNRLRNVLSEVSNFFCVSVAPSMTVSERKYYEIIILINDN